MPFSAIRFFFHVKSSLVINCHNPVPFRTDANLFIFVECEPEIKHKTIRYGLDIVNIILALVRLLWNSFYNLYWKNIEPIHLSMTTYNLWSVGNCSTTWTLSCEQWSCSCYSFPHVPAINKNTTERWLKWRQVSIVIVTVAVLHRISLRSLNSKISSKKNIVRVFVKFDLLVENDTMRVISLRSNSEMNSSHRWSWNESYSEC